MTTLNNEQTSFLTDYAMLQIETDVEVQLKKLKDSKEYIDAIEEGKLDKDVLDLIQSRKEEYEYDNEMFKVQEELKEKGNYVLAYNNGRDYGLDLVLFNEVEDIKKSLDLFLQERAEWYALNKTGYYTSFTGTIRREVYQEIQARLSVTNLGNFDEIVDSIVGRFDIEEIVHQYTESQKENK